MINIKTVLLVLLMILSLTQATHLNSVIMSSKVIAGNTTYEAIEVTIYASYI